MLVHLQNLQVMFYSEIKVTGAKIVFILLAGGLPPVKRQSCYYYYAPQMRHGNVFGLID